MSGFCRRGFFVCSQLWRPGGMNVTQRRSTICERIQRDRRTDGRTDRKELQSPTYSLIAASRIHSAGRHFRSVYVARWRATELLTPPQHCSCTAQHTPTCTIRHHYTYTNILRPAEVGMQVSKMSIWAPMNGTTCHPGFALKYQYHDIIYHDISKRKYKVIFSYLFTFDVIYLHLELLVQTSREMRHTTGLGATVSALTVSAPDTYATATAPAQFNWYNCYHPRSVA